MDLKHNWKFNTNAVHAGQQADPATGAVAVPIYQTASYQFNSSDHAARLFSLQEEGNIYTRIGNPTTSVFEERMNILEGGVGALAVSSGMSAIYAAVMSIAQMGDEIIASTNLYGGTYNLFFSVLPRMGIKTKFADPSDLDNFRRLLTDKVKAVYAETIGNPKMDVADLEALAAFAHDAGVPLIVDNTFATPYLCKPVEFGADIVVHSATKFIGGHGTSIAGVIVDGGTFDWTNGKFPGFVKPDSTYHDIRYALDCAPAAFITKARVQLLRDMGFCLSPFNSFLLLQGLETLHLRMECHSRNALEAARYLQAHSQVAWVNYPGLESSVDYSRAQKILPKGCGALLSFGIKGGKEAGKKFVDSLTLFSHLANVGDAKSLVIHPASTTHDQLTTEQRLAAGVTDDMIRLSVGIEDIEDIKQDLKQALQAVVD